MDCGDLEDKVSEPAWNDVAAGPRLTHQSSGDLFPRWQPPSESTGHEHRGEHWFFFKATRSIVRGLLCCLDVGLQMNNSYTQWLNEPLSSSEETLNTTNLRPLHGRVASLPIWSHCWGTPSVTSFPKCWPDISVYSLNCGWYIQWSDTPLMLLMLQRLVEKKKTGDILVCNIIVEVIHEDHRYKT